MSQRTIPWGTVLSGAIALGTAVLIALTEVAGLTISLRGLGPGAVIGIGLLILVVGLVVVLRAGRAARRETGEAAAPASQPGAQQPQAPAPTGADGEPAQSSH